MTVQEQAVRLATLGAKVIPFAQKTKFPTVLAWQKLATNDIATVNAWFEQTPDANYGVMGTLAVGAIVGFDMDNPELLAVIEAETGQKFPNTFHVRTSREEPGGHYYFRQTAYSVTLGNCDGPKNFEWRADNRQVVGPGSVHPTGSVYTATDWNTPILDIPDWLVDWMREYKLSSRDTQGVSELLLSESEAAADVDGKLAWVTRYLKEESANKGEKDPRRPVWFSKKPIPFQTGGKKGFKIYVQCPGKADHSDMFGISEAALILLPGIGLDFKCQHNSHYGDEFGWNWYRKMTETPDDLTDSINVSGVPLPPEEPKETFEDIFLSRPLQGNYDLTDSGNTMRLRDRFGDKIRFVGGEPYIWDGKRWALDQYEARLYQFASVVVSLIPQEAEGADEEYAKAITRWSKASGMLGRISAMVKLASKVRDFVPQYNPFDKHPELLNLDNGTFNLRTGKLQPHRREDMLSKISPTRFDPSAHSPRWDAFLQRIMDGDSEMADFLARAVGYASSGSVKEEVMYVAYGGGANGKSTFLETIRQVLGDEYAATADMGLLSKKRHGEGIPVDVAVLAGKRFVHLSETDKNERLNEAKLKKLVSNEDVSARKLYENPAAFKPVHHLWLGTNHKPLVSGTDTGLWRRLVLIGFEVTIPLAQQNKDIQDHLMEESSGILNWMLRGYEQYEKQGLNPPRKITAAVNEWRGEADHLNRFLQENCDFDTEYKQQSSMLYGSYKRWCGDNGEHILSSQDFKQRMSALGYTPKHTNTANLFLGLRLMGGGEL